ncbi:MAG TPA: acyl-CoA dehydrogenase family protein [Acidimicrobiia bacterium]
MEDLDQAEIRRIAREHLSLAIGSGSPAVNRPLLRSLAERGLLPRIFPVSMGGTNPSGVSAVDLCTIREALAMESTEAETALAVQGLGAYPIVLAGTEEQALRWIPEIARGERVAAFALTEARGGSDAAHLELKAVPDGDGWRLTGEKKWISNAPNADLYTVFARTTEGVGARGITAFLVEGDARGVGGTGLQLLTSHPVGTLTLDGAYVPADQVIGPLDQGFRVAMGTLDLFRPSVGAFAVGMARAALEAAIDYAHRRTAFGRPIGDFQAISHLLAEMATKTEAARLLVFEAARIYDEGRQSEITMRSAMAKLYATEVAQEVVDAAVQVHGAVALEEGHLLSHLYREVRTPRIYEGTSEIQREVIARELRRWAQETPG